jgi:hypothetical protein
MSEKLGVVVVVVVVVKAGGRVERLDCTDET